MMNKRKFLYVVALCFLAMLAFPISYGWAEEDQEIEMGTAYLKAVYSSDIEVHDGDIFVITYSVEGGTETAKIKVDASTIVEASAEMSMPSAYYTVKNIEYQGSNPVIQEQGFGMPHVFNSAPAGGLTTILYIGKEQCDKLEKDYADSYIVRDPDTNDKYTEQDEKRRQKRQKASNTDSEKEVTTAAPTETEYQYTTEDLDFDMEYNDEYGVEEQVQDGSQVPEVEHYNDPSEITTEEQVVQKEDEEKKGGLGKLILPIFILVAAGGVLFWAKKSS